MVPHLAEELYLYFPHKTSKTYFTRIPPKPESFWNNDKMEQVMKVILNCKKDINKILEANTMDAEVNIIFSKDLCKSLQVRRIF